MILRSQLRMNKNIVFPFISCIMIMFTLLILIHRSADELNTVKKELAHCKQQHDSTFSQLQSAIDFKLRLEKSLESEKTSGKKELEKLQMELHREKEERQKDKEEASSNYDSLNDKFKLLQTESQKNNDQSDKSNKKLLELGEELTRVKSNLKEVAIENEQKDKSINELREKLKTAENTSTLSKKAAPSEDAAPAANERLKVAAVQNSIKGPSTPQINPAAVGHFDELPKQVPAPLNGEQENLIQKEMRDSLNMKVADDVKLQQENVGKPPFEINNDKNQENVVNHGDDTNVEVPVQNNDKNQASMFLPMPLNFKQQNNKPAVSASNNAAENRDVLPAPLLIAAEKDKQKFENIKLHPGEYDNKIPEDENEGEYEENDLNGVKPKKIQVY